MTVELFSGAVNIARIKYGNDKRNKPNNHCYWNECWKCWMEDDDHFKQRVTKQLSGDKT